MHGRLSKMSRALLAILLLCGSAAYAQQATTASGGVVRVLDKVSGQLSDLELSSGETASLGHLKVTLNECRYPSSNPNGDAFAMVTVAYQDVKEPVFNGWLVASAPALNAMDHPRYDVWALRCITS